MDAPANLPALPSPPSSFGELVVQTGHSSGTRRPLRQPVTVLGQAHGCDLRLLDAGVAAHHCVIAFDKTGPVLRDLDSPTGTRVNGKRVQAHRLANGDLLEVGPVRFLVELETPPTSEGPSADSVLLDREREALRIQAAAVAAQQAALTDEESRLDQRGLALALQETQLAHHLDERQAALDEEIDSLRQQRVAFEEECTAGRAALVADSQAQERLRAELERERQHLGKQRLRTNDLRRRLWKRHQRQAAAREATLHHREADLATREQHLQRERERVRTFQERVNGELEVGRRALREDAEQLAVDQQRWLESAEEDRQDQARRRAELDRRETELQASAQAAAAELQRHQQTQAQLKRESDGLEARIRHQREQLESLRREAAPTPPPPGEVIPPAPAVPLPQGATECHQRLRGLAATLSDQRAHLAEQWQTLLALQEQWHEERLEALADLEATSGRLDRRERDLAAAELQLTAVRHTLTRREDELKASRGALDGWRARFAVEQAGWMAQREEGLAGLKERERLLDGRRQQFDEAKERHLRRSREELGAMQAARLRFEDARRQSGQLWQECEQLRAALAEQERWLAAEAAALEHLRDELIHQSPDSARADALLEKLTQRERSRADADARAVDAEREKLHGERSALEAEGRRLAQLEEELLQRQGEVIRQVEEWEQRGAVASSEEYRREEELRRLRALRGNDERQLRQLREEIERLARGLIEEALEPRTEAA